MIENSSHEKENIIKDTRNIYRLEKLTKETTDTTNKGIRNLFRLEKESKAIKGKIPRDIRNVFRLEKENKATKDIKLRDIRNLFENGEEEKCHKVVRWNNFWSSHCIEYESNGERNKVLSVEEYLNEIRPYLKDIVNNLKKSGTWKIQLTIANKFIFSKDNDEESLIHSESDKIEIMADEKIDQAIKKLFKSLKNRYPNNLSSEFVFDYVHSLYYKCHKINPNGGGSYKDSSYWIKKATINPINKKDNKCFRYAVTIVLNHEEIKKNLQRITKINLL